MNVLRAYLPVLLCGSLWWTSDTPAGSPSDYPLLWLEIRREQTQSLSLDPPLHEQFKDFKIFKIIFGGFKNKWPIGHIAQLIKTAPINNFFLFIWRLLSHSRIFHSYGDITIAGERLQILTYARHSWPLSSEGSLTCHTHCETGLPFKMVISEDPWHSHLMSSVWQWSCHYMFLWLRSVATRDWTPISRMRQANALPLRHRGGPINKHICAELWSQHWSVLYVKKNLIESSTNKDLVEFGPEILEKIFKFGQWIFANLLSSSHGKGQAPS